MQVSLQTWGHACDVEQPLRHPCGPSSIIWCCGCCCLHTHSLNTGLMPSSSLCAKGGGSTTFASDLFPVIWSGRVPQAPYSVTVRRRAVTSAPTPVTRAASTLTVPSTLFASVFHMQQAENPGGVMLQQRTPQPGAHRPVPAFENMRPASASACPRCTLMQRGVQHCARRHHKVCTPAPTRTRPAAPLEGPHKRRCLRSLGPSHYPLMRSPHIPLTPPVTKRRTPRTPPPSPTATLPQEMSEDDGMDVARPLFGQVHGRATQEIT